ncbi:hypothetical protein [Arenibacter algicola]|uniref:Uncharacterized protein n=1 Tax=Arenibacter algicola TaxID=616991 RepID=A0A221UUQ1_9FLAO|nr:hypothetical protein [Arenibacter algicola]ASO04641.1 hypothetical protein AREALGSMS7_01166 [Arenibacter algicola]
MEIGHILVKKLDGSLSVEEQKLFDNWIQESDDHRFMFLRLKIFYSNGHNISKVDDPYIKIYRSKL